jgi:hypothetical protein
MLLKVSVAQLPYSQRACPTFSIGREAPYRFEIGVSGGPIEPVGC